MNTINRILAKVGRWKVYLDRSRMYIGYLQFFAIVFIGLKSYEDSNIGMWFFKHLTWTLPVFIVLFFAVSVVVGYLDKRFIRPNEQREISMTNPITLEILSKLNKLLSNEKRLNT